MLQPIKYQSLNWRTTEAQRSECGHCKNEIFMDWTQQIVQAVKLTEFNGYNLMDYTYNGNLDLPIPTTRTPVLDQIIVGSPDDYCFDRTTGDPYWGSITVPFTERTSGASGVGDLRVNDYLKIEFTYTSNVVFYCRIELQRGTGFVVDTVNIELPANLTGGDITKYLSVTTTTASGYQLVITFYSSTVDDTAELCFSDLSVKNMSQVGSYAGGNVLFVDCYGDAEPIVFDEVKYDDIQILTFEFYDEFQMGYFELWSTINSSLTSTAYPRLYSNWFIPINPETYGDCKLDALLKIDWTNTCMYVVDGEQQSIDYSFYLQGYTQRLPRELGERILRTTGTGDTESIFDYSYSKTEIVTGVYSIWVHEILEGATSTNSFYANDQQYKPDASNIYTIAPLNNGTYTGRVEMREGDSQRVLSKCCCPVEEPDYSPCGDLRITDICIVAGQRLIKYELVGAVNATSVDVQFENLEAIDSSPCTVAINTTHDESSVSTIGAAANAVAFSASEWQTVFDDFYCEQTDIQYSIRIRTNCGDGDVGAWSDAYTIVPDNISVCS